MIFNDWIFDQYLNLFYENRTFFRFTFNGNIWNSRIVNMNGIEEVIFVPIIKFQDSQRFATMLRLFFFLTNHVRYVILRLYVEETYYYYYSCKKKSHRPF